MVAANGAVTLYDTPTVFGPLDVLGPDMVIVQLKLPTLEGASTVIEAILLDPGETIPLAGCK